MKAKIIAVVAAIALVGTIVPAIAEETSPSPPDKVQELHQQFLQERAEILAQILEKRAELVRLSVAKEPDVEKVKQLVGEIAELRNEEQKKCTEYRATVGVLRQPGLAPLGPPGAGGMGLGPGPAHRPQWGQEPPRSPRLGRGYGAGRGPAGQPGPGATWGGRAQGRRQAPGAGPGLGRGQGLWLGPGQGGFGGPGMGAPGASGARPWGRGRGFVDTDNDGVCDYWEGAANPPRPPVAPPPVEEEQPAPPSEV